MNAADKLAQIRKDLSYAQSHLTELATMLNETDAATPRPRDPARSVARAGLSPRELHPDACPHCEIVAGHTTDCPTLEEEPA